MFNISLFLFFFFFFFNDTATTEIYTLSLHDALPISPPLQVQERRPAPAPRRRSRKCPSQNRNETPPYSASGARRRIAPAAWPVPAAEQELPSPADPVFQDVLSAGSPPGGAPHPQRRATFSLSVY